MKKVQLEHQYEKLRFLYEHLPNSSFNLFLLQKITHWFKRQLLSYKVKSLESKLKRLPDRITLEKEIKKLENHFYNASKSYLRNIYLKTIFKKSKKIGKVNSFLDHLESKHIYDNTKNIYISTLTYF